MFDKHIFFKRLYVPISFFFNYTYCVQNLELITLNITISTMVMCGIFRKIYLLLPIYLVCTFSIHNANSHYGISP